MDAIAAPWHKLIRTLAGTDTAEEAGSSIWALDDVSFDVPPGAVMGIIGRNGAGKSTLLKILSKITEPTSGRIELVGRVVSLLEVGTGFHHELTGRENIFLNGVILGMRRREIVRKFDQIVEFAEIEKFLDTPVKHYSSGMYVRLAFAVAAHLEPEILLVDEVLAVGDAAFQKKCMGKMGAVAKEEGRTVLLVSHNMDAIRRLCGQAAWLHEGKLQYVGPTAQCINSYMHSTLQEGGDVVFEPPRGLANRMPVVLHALRLRDPSGVSRTRFSAKEPIEVRIDWESFEDLYKPRIGFVLQTAEGQDVLTAVDAVSWTMEKLPAGRRISRCTIPGGVLNEGDYILDIGGDVPNRFGFQPGRTGALIRFSIDDDGTLPNKYYGEEGFRDARWPGLMLMNIPWTQEAAEPAAHEKIDQTP